jgi:hypothetical protein
MARLKACLIVLALLLALLLPTAPERRSSSTPRLAALDPLATTTAILTFDHRPSATEVARVQAAGLRIHTFRTLPMIAVRGPKRAVERQTTLSGLVSVYLDRPLRY